MSSRSVQYELVVGVWLFRRCRFELFTCGSIGVKLKQGPGQIRIRKNTTSGVGYQRDYKVSTEWQQL
jgi:hypothetical protein